MANVSCAGWASGAALEPEHMRLILTALPHASDALFSGTAYISQSRYSIGRGENNDWVLSDAKRLISKNHCFIEPAEQGFRLVDQSTNGTTVSGKPVDRNAGQILQQGDEVELGPYRFRVALEGASRPQDGPGSAFGDASAPRITSILHDVAPAGIGAKSMIPGEHRDAFGDAGSRKGRFGSGSLAADLGWDGPPSADAEVVRSASPNVLPYREFADRMEQGPTHKVLIDLPKPAATPLARTNVEPPLPGVQIIPENWLDDEDETSPASPPGLTARHSGVDDPVTRSGPADFASLNAAGIVPVENIDLRDSGAASGPARAFAAPETSGGRSADILDTTGLAAAFCDGLGVNPGDLADVDGMRFFHNAGRALAICVAELQNAQIAKSRASALLEMNGENLGRTPWIFSLGGEDKAKAIHAVAAFLADAEPRDLEMMRDDHKDVQALVGQLSQTIIGLVEHVQQSMSVAGLEKHVSAAARAIPSLRKAALWDALLARSGLFPQELKSPAKADLMPLLRAELKKHDKSAS
jgi:type VI secretion system protein